MTREKPIPSVADWKEAVRADPDFLKTTERIVLKEVLDAEMTEAVGTANGERTSQRLGHRSDYYTRDLITV